MSKDQVKIMEFGDTIIIQNVSDDDVYVGLGESANSAEGLQVSPGESLEMKLTEQDKAKFNFSSKKMVTLEQLQDLLSKSDEDLALDMTSDDETTRKFAEMIYERLHRET